MRRRAFLAPEVVQTSSMDCGPASLRCLLGAWGIDVDFDQLRDACQTDVDGTSVDVLVDIARANGIDAQQELLPLDHVLEPASRVLPAIGLLRQPQGTLHTVVIWRAVGPFVQIMDPARGRRWMRRERLFDDLYIHRVTMRATAFARWVRSPTFVANLRSRLSRLGASGRAMEALVASALAAAGWRALALLDAAVRLTSALVEARSVPNGAAAVGVVNGLVARAAARAIPFDVVPAGYWAGVPAEPTPDGHEQVEARGAVLVVARALVAPRARNAAVTVQATPRRRHVGNLLEMLRLDGRGTAAALALALVIAGLGAMVEALLLRGLMECGLDLGLWQERAAAMVAVLVFLLALAALELPIALLGAGIGRRLEGRLRLAILAKLPLLGDRYFRSRPGSDLADRCHEVHRVRQLPQLAQQVLQVGVTLVVTLIGLLWLAGASGPIAIAAAVSPVVVAFAFGPALVERDMRVRTHGGALIRFYLDGLLGLVAVRTHGAERALRREHEALLTEWVRAGRSVTSASVLAEAAQAVVGYGLAGWLVLDHLHRGADAGATLLVIYWALLLPRLGEELVAVVRQYPVVHNTTQRLVEPLVAPCEVERIEPTSASRRAGAVRMELAGVSVVYAAHPILDDVSLSIAPGEHVGIVGASGAGKSSLVGLLLGWHRSTSGTVLVDGVELDATRLAALRRDTAWVAPEVLLWNRTLHQNLVYGVDDAHASLRPIVEQVELADVLARLPRGWQTGLGEGGGLVSGGEGQRVRLGRALGRRRPRLVILDEAFHGLERARRAALLDTARTTWADVTLLCVTHDVADTLALPRVIVLDGGRIVEDDAPSRLASRPSRYRALLDAERVAAEHVWGKESWRRLELRAR